MNRFTIFFGILLLLGCNRSVETKETRKEYKFSFVFMTDIHMQNKRGAYEAFQMVIDTVNKMDAAFVVTGGDLVYDVMRGRPQRSDSLFSLYKESISKFKVPVHNTIGNHELFGIYAESDIDSLHPDYKYGLYERQIGKTHHSFDYGGWHFISVNSIVEKNQRYIGLISEEEKEWIKAEIAETDPTTPIALVTHIPFVTSFYQVHEWDDIEVPNGRQIANSAEILELFKDHNLKLVLQGHVHWVEDINVKGKIRFITGGAVAGRPSWRGAQHNEEGFMYMHIGQHDEISWDYIDYGWEARVE